MCLACVRFLSAQVVLERNASRVKLEALLAPFEAARGGVKPNVFVLGVGHSQYAVWKLDVFFCFLKTKKKTQRTVSYGRI